MPSGNGRQSTLDEVGDLSAPQGSREWCVAVLGETRKAIHVLESDAKSAGDWLQALKETKAWKTVGLISWSALCVQIGIDDDQAEALINAKKGQSVGYVLQKHGGDRRSEQAKRDQACDTRLKYGTVEYFLARLERDHPDIDPDDYPSVRQAAIAAGIVKVKTPAEQAIHWLKKCTTEQWNEVVDWIDQQQ